MKTFYDYTAAIKSGKGYKNISRLEFLQPDGSVAFSVGSYKKQGYQKAHDTRAFLQDGTLNISLKNGLRRKATVKFANADEAFSYNVNNIWFGKTVRLLMGIEFADGDEYMFSQGVFVIQNPNAVINPAEKTITYELSDKWVNLNGENGGAYDATYRVPIGSNIFTVMKSLLELSRYTFEYDGNKDNMFDSTEPVFTEYYNNKRYIDEQTSDYVNYVDTPYEVVTDSMNGTIADTLLELNTILAGWIGYNANGALTVEASQDDISDASKPTMWTFTPDNSVLCGLSESSKTADVKNDIIISSEDLNDREIWGRASNYDDRSDTNINLIGKRTYREAKSTYWSVEQCVALAQYELKKRSIVQKSITIECAPMFHLNENEVVAVVRTDKEGSPTERHLIQSITIPISETGSMQINATSVNDIPILKYSSSTKKGKPMLNEALYLAIIAELRTEGGKAHTFQIPTITGTYKYTGSSQTPTITGYYGDFMTKTGNTSATNAGSYSITFSLTDTENCQWSDGTITDKVVTWSIEKAALPKPTLSQNAVILSASYSTNTITVSRVGDGNIIASSSVPSKVSVSVSGTSVTITALDTTDETDATVTITVAESTNYLAYTASDVTCFVGVRVSVRTTISGLGSQNPADVTFIKDPRFTLEGLGISEVEYNGDVFISIPTMYRKVNTVTSGQITSFTISNTKVDNTYEPYPVFVAEDRTTILPYVLIGKYCTSSTTSMVSVSSSGWVSKSIGTTRGYAADRGAGYQLFDWQFWKLWQDLLVAIMGTVDTNPGTATTGDDAIGVYWKSGSIYMDGLWYEDSGTNFFSYLPTQYVDSPTRSTPGYQAIPSDVKIISTDGTPYEIKKLGYNSSTPFLNLPRTVNVLGNYSTYYCDSVFTASPSVTGTSSHLITCGYYFNSSGSSNIRYGAYTISAQSGTGSVNSHYSRLCYRPVSS